MNEDTTIYMTFSEALEQYLYAREVLHGCEVAHGPQYSGAKAEMEEAARQMDAITGRRDED